MGRRSQRSRVSPRTRGASPARGADRARSCRSRYHGRREPVRRSSSTSGLDAVRERADPGGPAVRDVVQGPGRSSSADPEAVGTRTRPGGATRGRSRAPASAIDAQRGQSPLAIDERRRSRRGSPPRPRRVPPRRRELPPSRPPATARSTESNSPGRSRCGSSSGASASGSAHQPAADPAPGDARGRPPRSRARAPTLGRLPSLQASMAAGTPAEHREVRRDLRVTHRHGDAGASRLARRAPGPRRSSRRQREAGSPTGSAVSPTRPLSALLAARQTGGVLVQANDALDGRAERDT